MTRQVETRIKRQIIMEDGKVIADSGPQITTRTKEDNWTEESENCAKKGSPVDAKSIVPMVKSSPVKIEKDHVVCEKIETKNTTREAKHERFQYHDESISELTGYDIHQKALVSPNDLITINCDLIDVKQDIEEANFEDKGVIDDPPKGKLTHYSSKSHKVTDKEEIKETSKLGVDGEIKTETVRTHHHEEVDDDEEPDEDEDSSKKSKDIKELTVNQLPEISKETSNRIEYSQNYETPIIQPNNEGNHRGHVDIKPIYDIGGRADHTTKWLESHFGSSDTSQNDKEISSSSGSAVDRRGRPRQRINPAMSQSYDEAYYSRSNTYGENTNRSHSNLSKPSTDKFDCLTSPSPSPVAPIGSRKSTKKLANHEIGYDKANDSGNSNGTCTSSESSYYNGVDYHHSSEGSLSPSGHSYNTNQTFSKHQRCHCFTDSPVNKRFSHQSHDSKPVSINSSQHFIKSNHKNNNNNRNLIIRVKHRVSKEDASVQASLSDEEYNYDDFKETAKHGRNAIVITDVNKNVGGTIVRPRPIKTYYFGEKVEPIVGSDCSNNQIDSNNNNNSGHGDKSFGKKNYSQILPIDCSFNSTSYAYQGDPDEMKMPFIENGKFLTSPEHKRIINGSLDRLFNGSSRTDLFQTRDRGSLSNWRSTINLRSNGLATIDAPLTRSGLYQSKDDSCKSYRDSGFRANTFTRKHHGSVNCLNERFKYDQIDDKLDSFGFNSSNRGLSPIQERKSLLNLRKIDLILKDKSNGATRWPVLNSSSNKIKNVSSLYNGFDNYHIPREANSFRNRSTTLSYFKAH
uniref:Uncharacterized protein n=1 Tax=Tetranychus urticae TaxID=32264 RepID=T1L3V8_TETUR